MGYNEPSDLPTFLGDYAIEHELGRGGMKLVVKAFDRATQRTVALALLRARFPNPEVQSRFFREARAMESLDHPNIVKVLAHGTIEGQPYFAMQYVNGEPLSDRLLGEKLPAHEAVELLILVCRAVEYAHRQGVLHRDIKPANVLIDADGTPRLADFGLAKDVQDDRELTRVGQGLGTLAYVSPEQRNGESANVSETSDVYSLGVTLLEVLLGTPAFFEHFGRQQPYAVLSGSGPSQPVDVLGVPAALLAVCRKCVHPDPDARFQSAASLADALELVLESGELNNLLVVATPSREAETIVRSHVPPSQGHATAALLGPGSTVARKYTLTTLLRRTLMGEVWKAEAANRDSSVVVKFLPEVLRNNPVEMSRLQRSFRLVESLHHSHICPLYDLDEDPAAGVFLVMKYVEGIDLGQLCQRRRASGALFSLADACRILYPVAQAIDYAHSHNVLHRDIKPDNIMVSDEGENPQVVDFGLAEEIRSTVTRFTAAPIPSGTLRYISPEAWQGRSSRRESDQYALGVMAYEMLGGRSPFDGSTPEVLRQCVLNEPVPALNLPQAVNQVFAKVLHKDPACRFDTCTAFVEALRRSHDGLRADSAPAEAGRPNGRRTTVAAISGAACLGAAAVLALLEWGSPPPSDPAPPLRDSAEATEPDLQAGALANDAQEDPQPRLEPPHDSTLSKPRTKEELAQAALKLGELRIRSQQFAAAVEAFDQALELDGNLAAAYRGRGFSKHKLGEYQAALSDLDRAIDLDPNGTEAYLDRGDLLRDVGAQLLDDGAQSQARSYLHGAHEDYTKALKLDPQSDRGHQGRGLTNLMLGDTREAIDDLSAAIDAGQSGSQVYEARGEAYFARKRFAEARRDFLKARELAADPSRLDRRIAECDQELRQASP